jgi:RND superfamily putative drug exporter
MMRGGLALVTGRRRPTGCGAMMAWLGRIVSRTWVFWLVAWILAWAGTWAIAPGWSEVARDGEFNFLPRGIPSRRGEELLRRAFPGRRAESSVVVVVTREGGKQGLTEADRRFITNVLRPGLERIASEESRSRGERAGQRRPHKPIIGRILTFQGKEGGPLLISADQHASLVIIELRTEFLLRSNIPVVGKIDDLIKRLQRDRSVPAGLRVSLTGSAAIGRDMLQAESESARAIQSWTTWIVIVLLLLFYRAPLIALIPMVTLFAALSVAIRLLELLAEAGYIELFRGLDVYATVVAYAAGVDYNLFLISRYQEELEDGAEGGPAMAQALGKIGGPLTASAATVICGIGMLMIAQFGKFRQAGFGISFSVFMMLCATMTLTPALLRLAGRWAFWPRRIGAGRQGYEANRGWMGWNPFQGLWELIGRAIERRPGTIWLLTVVVLSPFAAYAIWYYDDVNYGLIQGLSPQAPSRRGMRELVKHYPAGASGPLTLVIRNDRIDFALQENLKRMQILTSRLQQRRDALEIADLRTVTEPLGTGPVARNSLPGGILAAGIARVLEVGEGLGHYVSNTPELDHHVTRLDLMLRTDPFTRHSIKHLDELEDSLQRALPEPFREGAEVYLVGPTASFRDLKVVAERDRRRIVLMVTVSVLIVLVALLRRLAIPIYLIASVLFGYLVTLGVTFAVFRLRAGASFPGLDWTVPIFLFTLLVAVGEDYNIILVTRIDEEQDRHGPVRGVTAALARTGGIISGCGFIMAGTFSSLAFGGSLARMYELGFALTFGVLLDTFIVRPILVPAYLVFVNSGRLGRLGPYLGARREGPVAARP